MQVAVVALLVVLVAVVVLVRNLEQQILAVVAQVGMELVTLAVQVVQVSL
jgi:hypothetical protein